MCHKTEIVVVFPGRTVHAERTGREGRTTALQKQMDDASPNDRRKYKELFTLSATDRECMF